MLKIALFGKMRSGKDTVGKLLIDNYGFKRYAFGDGIGEIVAKYFPDALEHGKPRQHYQHIGQSLRELDPDVWIKYLYKQIGDTSDNIVVTDARQPNEYKSLKKNGFIIVKLEADEETRIQRILDSGDTFSIEQLEHPTEKNVDSVDADFTICNNGDLNSLKRSVANLVYLIKEGTK